MTSGANMMSPANCPSNAVMSGGPAGPRGMRPAGPQMYPPSGHPEMTSIQPVCCSYLLAINAKLVQDLLG